MHGDTFQAGVDESAADEIAEYAVKLARNRLESWREGTIRDMISMIESDARQNLGEFSDVMAVVASYTDSIGEALSRKLFEICVLLPGAGMMIIVAVCGRSFYYVGNSRRALCYCFQEHALSWNFPSALLRTVTDSRMDEMEEKPTAFETEKTAREANTYAY